MDEIEIFKTKVKCPQCSHKLNLRTLFVIFYIEGFILVKWSTIFARDRGVSSKYFSKSAGCEHCLKNNPVNYVCRINSRGPFKAVKGILALKHVD